MSKTKTPPKKYQIIAAPTAQEIKTKPAGKKIPKPKSSPTAYYNCLMNYAQQDFYDAEKGKKQKIHTCCKKCKQNAPALNNQRDQELVKLITSYKQVGDSLAKLLHPIK
jgi:hypothetical protein